jgi:hypothetical protein
MDLYMKEREGKPNADSQSRSPMPSTSAEPSSSPWGQARLVGAGEANGGRKPPASCRARQHQTLGKPPGQIPSQHHLFGDVIVPEESKEESKKQIDIPQPVASTPPINRQAGEAGSGRHNSHQTWKNIAEDNGHEEDDETPPPPVDKSKKTTWTGELAGLDHESILGDSWEPPAGTRRTRSSCIRLQESSQLAPDVEEYDDYLAPIFAAACISDSSATDGMCISESANRL